VEPRTRTEDRCKLRPASDSAASRPALRLAPQEYSVLVSLILEAEKGGTVTRTFRRLDPEQHVAIIDAVLQEIVEAGRSGATMRGISARLGISAASLYSYFPDREAMIRFATSAASRIIVSTVWDDWAHPASRSLAEGLSSYVADDVGFSEEHWSMIELLAQSGYRGEEYGTGDAVQGVATGMRSHLLGLLADARERGELREGLDDEAVGAVIYALLTVLADARFYEHLNTYLQLFASEGPTADEIVAAAVDMIVNGVCRGA
jgi:AcrR family transcriptional regulator